MGHLGFPNYTSLEALTAAHIFSSYHTVVNHVQVCTPEALLVDSTPLLRFLVFLRLVVGDPRPLHVV